MKSYRLAYRAMADGVSGDLRVLDIFGCGSYSTQDLDITVRIDDETLSFSVRPLHPVALESFRVEVSHEFARDEEILLNGYQSWTETAWRPASEGMRGLQGVPGVVRDRWALDGIGDYRFAEYGGAGMQHGYTYAAFRWGDSFALLGSLDDGDAFTRIRTDAQEGSVVLERECPRGVLEPGKVVSLGAFALLNDGEDEAYDRWFALAGIVARPVKPLVGYSSWYRHYGEIDQVKLVADLEATREAMNSLGLLDGGAAGTEAFAIPERQGRSGGASSSASAPCQRAALPPNRQFLPLFQVDDGYCKVGDWRDVDAGKFPDGLASLAARIRGAGFLPGLWMAPFVCERDSCVYAEHADWLLRDDAGNPVRTGPHWSGALALDTRNPAVRAHVHDAVRTAVREWGFGLLKLDFLYAACMVPHDGMNRGQLMADAMALLRDAAGEDCLLLGCGVPLASAFGVVDYCRIGCDVGLDWDDKPHMRLLHRERVSTKNSLGNTLSRAPLDGRAFGNDPDVFFLRDDVKFSADRRRMLLRADALCGSMLLTSDDMGSWGADERALFVDALRELLARKNAQEGIVLSCAHA